MEVLFCLVFYNHRIFDGVISNINMQITTSSFHK